MPNLRELDLDRVIAFGHTWSPTLELAPPMPLLPRARDRHRHGAVDDVGRAAGLHLGQRPRPDLLAHEPRRSRARQPPPHGRAAPRGHGAILQTRDGLLRAAVPRPVGTCYFVNDLTGNELDETLAAHRAVVRRYPRAGDGEDMFLGS